MIGDVYALQIVGRYQGQQIVNTFHYQQYIETTPGDEEAVLAGLFQDAMRTPYQDATSTGVQIDTVQVRKVLPLPVGPGLVFDAGWVGTRAGVSLPSEVAAVIKRLTATAGPKGRGRIYVPGGLASDVFAATGLWTTEYKDFLDEVALVMRTSLDGEFTQSYLPVLYSPTTLIARQILRSGVNVAPRAQRRRQPGRGV